MQSEARRAAGSSVGLVETKRVVLFTSDDPLVLDSGATLAPGRGRLRDVRRAERRRVERDPRLPRADRRRARRGPPRRSRAGRLVGQPDRPRQAARHRALARHLGQPARRLPRHDRAVLDRPGDGPAVRAALPALHRRRPGARCTAGCSRTSASSGSPLRSAARSAAMQVLQWTIDHPGRARRGDPGLRLGPALGAEHRVLGGGAHVDHGRRALRRRRLLRDGRAPRRRARGRADAGAPHVRLRAVARGEVRPAVPRRRRAQPGFGIDFEVESYLDHQASSFLERFDANSYLYLSRVMDYFDPFADAEAVRARLQRASTRDAGRVVRHRLALPDAPLGRDRPHARVGRRAGLAPRDRLALRARLVPAAGPRVPRGRAGVPRRRAKTRRSARPALCSSVGCRTPRPGCARAASRGTSSRRPCG